MYIPTQAKDCVHLKILVVNKEPIYFTYIRMYIVGL